MENAFGFGIILIELWAFAFSLGLAYKNRGEIKKWLNQPYYAEDDRELRLTRRIEDCQKELDSIRSEKQSGKAETGA